MVSLIRALVRYLRFASAISSESAALRVLSARAIELRLAHIERMLARYVTFIGSVVICPLLRAHTVSIALHFKHNKHVLCRICVCFHSCYLLWLCNVDIEFYRKNAFDANHLKALCWTNFVRYFWRCDSYTCGYWLKIVRCIRVCRSVYGLIIYRALCRVTIIVDRVLAAQIVKVEISTCGLCGEYTNDRTDICVRLYYADRQNEQWPLNNIRCTCVNGLIVFCFVNAMKYWLL